MGTWGPCAKAGAAVQRGAEHWRFLVAAAEAVTCCARAMPGMQRVREPLAHKHTR
eukprot:NODE_6184_length_523_cov_291.423077.p5 GENE.NODE_6184_length_523_cov_291.423077~~NODE_6184_length_523_cov_291.423077.p5  ORF type:complete len:55 (+),score=10.50 NODE_6184_length_523_cov_291.423077:164-328(+)